MNLYAMTARIEVEKNKMTTHLTILKKNLMMNMMSGVRIEV